MTQETENLCAARSYIKGMLHATLIMVRNDLHMGDPKSALAKVNDAIKLMEEKVEKLFYGHEKTESLEQVPEGN